MKAHEAEHKYIAGEAYMHKQDQQKHILVSKYALTAPLQGSPVHSAAQEAQPNKPSVDDF